MKTISSRRYAEEVEDNIRCNLQSALASSFCYITKLFGCIEDYDGREVAASRMLEEFDEGLAAEWRDQAIELFERYGMDVQPDGRDF